MGILRNVFKRGPKKEIAAAAGAQPSDEEWEDLPLYIEADAEEVGLVSVIASCLAAEHYPQSRFAVKQIRQFNPEAREIAVIAAGLAAEYADDCQLTVTKIAKNKTSKEKEHVTQV